MSTPELPAVPDEEDLRGVDAYLAAHAGAGLWFGVAGLGHRPREDMLSVLSMPSHLGAVRSGAAVYGTAAVGPQENAEVVMFGLVTATSPDGAPVVIGIHNQSQFGPPFCNLEVLAAEQSAAAATRDEIERLMRVHDVFRGQVLSFTASEHHGNELVSFLPRPAVAAQDIVLPDGVLEHIEEHIIGVADWSRELLSAGQHLKRGLLLHGPPGTGKTHTVRYLMGRLSTCTVILLTGLSIRYIEAMDGVGTDADVTFVLTTNRADVLETALADRPGRIDLAVEIPRPDARCRERLLGVYARDLTVDADLGPVVQGTEGVTASFVKEMIRRTVLVSLRAGDSPPVLRGAYFADVLTEMTDERQALPRSLLGGNPAGNIAGVSGPGPDAADLAGRPAPIRHRRGR